MSAPPMSPTIESRTRATIAAERLASPRTAESVAHIAASWAGYAALAWVVVTVGWWPAKVAAWLTMGWLLVGNGAMVHEVLHGHVSRSPRVSRVLGVIAGGSILMPYSTYKAFHLAHHQHTASELDPEGIPPTIPSRLFYPLVFTGGLAFMVELAAYGVQTMAGRPPRWVRNPRQRHDIVVDSTIVWVVFAAIVAGLVTAPAIVASVWLVPWLIAVVVLLPLVLSPEHYGADNPPISVLGTTRTVRSNPLVRWAYWNMNFHTAHHLSPAVVHQNLPRVHELLEPEMAETWKATGYLRYHATLFRSLPWRAPSRAEP